MTTKTTHTKSGTKVTASKKEVSTSETSTQPSPQTVNSPVGVLIEHIITDQDLLKEAEVAIESAKEDKKAISDRLKEHRKDAYHLYKYANPDEQKKLIELGFNVESHESGMNSVAQIAMDILYKAKKKLTGEGLYNEYVGSMKVGEEPLSYTNFNIKIRSLFSSMKLLRQKVEDGNNSRTDLIYINGFEYNN